VRHTAAQSVAIVALEGRACDRTRWWFVMKIRSQKWLDTCASGSYANAYGSATYPDQRAFVRQAIDSGRLLREEDAVKEALSLWEERERGARKS